MSLRPEFSRAPMRFMNGDVCRVIMSLFLHDEIRRVNNNNGTPPARIPMTGARDLCIGDS
jgi:hypothetical protein